jgi:hypothetical protein
VAVWLLVREAVERARPVLVVRVLGGEAKLRTTPC